MPDDLTPARKMLRRWAFRLWLLAMMPLWRYRCGEWGWEAVQSGWNCEAMR